MSQVPTAASSTAVLLAAGAGTRLGRGPKALLPFRGRPLVESVAEALHAGGCRDVVVVLGAGAVDVLSDADLGRFRTVVNHEWQSGMGGSLLTGNSAADPAHHLLVALVDQPGLTAAAVQRLLSAHRPGRITAAAYGSGPDLRRGHPLLIDATLRAAVVRSVKGDAGARVFLKAHPELVDQVDCSDLSDGEDVDTPDKLYLLND